MTELANRSGQEGNFVSANGLKIYYKEWGIGKSLVLLHGATDTHAFWTSFIPALSERYRVIVPDNRGHGRTINPAPILTYSMMADDLAGLVQELDLDSPLIFGFSDGGQAALDLAIRYPDLAGALVLGGIWHQFTQYYQDAISRAGFVSPGIMQFDLYEKQAPWDWEKRLRQAHHDPRTDYPRILLSALAALWWTPLNYSKMDLDRIQVPVLVLAGENDEFIPLEDAYDLAAKIPAAELAVVPDADHSSLIQKGIDQVLEFLYRQDP
jgi:pimeloyl-ACP methyl ester carboxylesterase